ncbi:MAG TPA: protein-methionine-sulfoxide reductase heme-binding subunit MsrQ [Terriglobales bacterium]|nr:protein-methionine-sulfoxide reductase heme-binding subunit MsrQ [Terriglobales bacterium]
MRRITILKTVLFLASLGPLVRLLWRGVHGTLGANPIEFITRSTGEWILVFLMATLAITPLRKLTGVSELVRFRRMLGLFAFFYGCLHLTTYVWLDQNFNFAGMVPDVYKRPFITAGFTGFVLMLPLALTSTRGWIARLGGKRWQALHRLIYLSALAGVIHFVWLVKRVTIRPQTYAAIFAMLMLSRLLLWLVPLLRARVAGPPSTASATAD